MRKLSVAVAVLVFALFVRAQETGGIPAFRVFTVNSGAVAAATTNAAPLAGDPGRAMPRFIAYCWNPTLQAVAPCNFTNALSTGETTYTVTTSSPALAIDAATVLATVSLQANASFTIKAGGPGQRKVMTWCATGAYTITPPSNVRGFVQPGHAAGKCTTQAFTYHPSLSAWLATDAGVVNQ